MLANVGEDKFRTIGTRTNYIVLDHQDDANINWVVFVKI